MKSMKGKINVQFCWITGVSTILTLLFVTLIYFDVFTKEIYENLETYAELLEETEMLSDDETLEHLKHVSDLRITIIQNDGTVSFDNDVDIGELDNHADREEVEQAFQSGYGRSVRRSKTVDKSTFYVALHLTDGSVLRVAKEAGSVWSMMGRAVPYAILVLLVMFLMCALVSRLLTKSMLDPIEQMAEHLNDGDGVAAYQELTPFITTIQKQHEDIMKNAKMRQEFTANVSHELKTPLTAISGYAELIENGMATPEQSVKFSTEIHKSSNRLLKLINDIIKLSQLDASDLQIVYEKVDLYACAEECMDWLSQSAEKNEITMQLFGTREKIYAGQDMMEELIYNLCDNAIRYNNKGGKVTVTITNDIDNVYLIVKDDGIGISREHQERIFERFYRVDKSRSKSTGGTGLGLAIVKHIMVRHNAKMELVSEVGRGTEIKIIFNRNQNELLGKTKEQESAL